VNTTSVPSTASSTMTATEEVSCETSPDTSVGIATIGIEASSGTSAIRAMSHLVGGR
jgi:hypothetical protein